MRKKKAAMIKQYSALGISLFLIGGLIVMTIIESTRKTPKLPE